MKRSAIQRKTVLTRTTWLRSRPKPVSRTDPARMLWKTSQAGFCQCGCDRFSLHLERHHVLERQVLRREGRLDVEFDLRNGMLLHQLCHARHTAAVRRIRIEQVPEEALRFVVEVLGEDRATLYIARTYRAKEAT